MQNRILLVLTGVVLLATACVPPSVNSGGSDRNVLTREQVVETNAYSLYEAVQNLRPNWLTNRGPRSMTDDSPSSASVFINGNHVGDVEYLRQVRPDDVDEIRFYEVGEASARFGMGHPGGVIDVVMRGQGL